ncbi:MAG: malate synthase [Nitrososphaerota archaeon]
MLLIRALEDYRDLFGEKEVNGRRVVVEELIAEAAEKIGPEIDKVLEGRRLWLEDNRPLREKGMFPRWDEVFTDADGDSRTFREIVQGLIDNFLGRDTPLRWRLNENVPIPGDVHPLKNPGLEITGPWHPLSRAINQINADVVVAFEDEEDAAPAMYVPFGSRERHAAIWEARRNVKRVLAGDLPPEYHERGKVYRVIKPRREWPAVFHRLPGLHLLDFDILLNGKPIPLIVTSAVIFVLNNYESLRRAGSGVYFYIPKIQTPEEALVVERLLRIIEDAIGVRYGSIKIAMLYEEGQAGRFLPVILWVWRERLIKSSNGRWDYLGSLIEMWKDEAVFPDPQNITMSSPNMVVYQKYNALMMLMAGLSHGEASAAPVGGMAAVMLYPASDYFRRNRFNLKALRDIKLDKLRERLLGLIFVPDEPVKTRENVTLEDILQGQVKGKLYDMFRQSWVATKEESYIAAGNEPLRAEVSKLQSIIDAEVKFETVDGVAYPTVDSGLTEEEKNRFRRLGLLADDGKIRPWVILKEAIDTPEKLLSSSIWGENGLWHGLYDPPKGDITVEHIQHAFYMAANYGFQVLNGNLAAAIDDYELKQRFMNDLATYRIFVSWLWTLLYHGASITQGGYLKGPELTEIGVIPSVNRYRVDERTAFSKDIFNTLLKLHSDWVEAFYLEQDRRAVARILDVAKPGVEVDASTANKALLIVRRAYGSGPFREASDVEAAKAIAEILKSSHDAVLRELRFNAPRFDRSKAPIIMEILQMQLTSPRYIQHSARLLFVAAGLSEGEVKHLLTAVFSRSREDVIEMVRRGLLDRRWLELHDYIYDYRAERS